MEIKANELEQKIDKIKQNIENYSLEIDEGTKKLKKEYHRKAVENRNNYIKTMKEDYSNYLKIIYDILEERKEKMIPPSNLDTSSKFENIKKYRKIIMYSEDKRKLEDKLGYLEIILKIQDNDHIDLEYINNKLLEIVDYLEMHNINIELNSFNYTMFTKKYMEVLLNNRTNPEFLKIMKDEFEKLYWECPNIITHLRLMIEDLLLKNQKELNNFYLLKMKEIVKEVDKYSYIKLLIDTKEELRYQDEYNLNNIIKQFLEKKRLINEYLPDSSVRNKLYDDFIINGCFMDFDENERNEFYNNIWDLEDILFELKGYYKFSKIINSTLEKYKDKDKFKGVLTSKIKEIEKKEKERDTINKKYENIIKPKIFKSKKKTIGKGNALKNQMNQIINQIANSKEEIIEHEMNDNIYKYLNDDSTLLDLIVLINSNVTYLKWFINKEYSSLDNDSVFKMIDDFFDYCYSKHDMLEKINVLSEANILDIVYDKYRLLNINLSKEMLEEDNIDSLLNKIDIFRVIYSVDLSTISFNDIKQLCEISNLKSLD